MLICIFLLISPLLEYLSQMPLFLQHLAALPSSQINVKLLVMLHNNTSTWDFVSFQCVDFFAPLLILVIAHIHGVSFLSYRLPPFQTAWTGDPGRPRGVGDAGPGGSDARLRPRPEDEPQGGPQAPLLRQALRLPEAGGSLKTYPAPPDLV